MSQVSVAPSDSVLVSLDDRDVALFIGPNAELIVAKLRFYEVDKTTGRPPKDLFIFFRMTIWPSFFLGVVWYLYRRMYVEALAVMAAFVLLDVALALLGIDLGTGLNTGIGLGVGIAGPLFYLRHVKRKVARIRRDSAAPEEREARLHRAGGVDWISPSLLLLLLAALFWWAFVA